MEDIIKKLLKFKEDGELLKKENERLKKENLCFKGENECLKKKLKAFEQSTPITFNGNQSVNEDYLLNVAETATRLKTNKNFVYELINKGYLKCLIMGSKKVRNSEINRFLVEYEGKDLTDLNNIKNT